PGAEPGRHHQPGVDASAAFSRRIRSTVSVSLPPAVGSGRFGTRRSGTAPEHPRALRRSPKGGRPRYPAGPGRRSKPKHSHRGHPVPGPWKRRSQAVRERKTSVLRPCRVPNPAKRIERRAASENPLRATTINDFAKLGTALGGTPTIV